MKSTYFLSMLILLILVTASQPATAELKMGSPFGDNMVLQRDMDLNFWGWADAGATVSVSLRDQTVKTLADADGKWQATLKPIQVGDEFSVKVESGSETISIENCLAGEVWICSGQSNMEWPVRLAKEFEQEAAAADLKQIRHMKVINNTAMLQKKLPKHLAGAFAALKPLETTQPSASFLPESYTKNSGFLLD